jgi:DNA polymerase I
MLQSFIGQMKPLFIKEKQVSRKRLVLVDGMSHIYRAYYAIPRLTNSKGFPTNAIYGFTTILRKIIDDLKPDYIGVAVDLEGPTLRHEKLESYKATRKPMPEELALQIPFMSRVCDVFRIPLISLPGYEADDVIGTLSRKAMAAGLDSILATSDKDMMQLVNDHICIMDAMKDNLIIDASKVVEKLGVTPEQVPDLLGLWGDASDNIPGAPGIGEKGAKELIQTFGTLENALKNWDKVKRKAYQESLRDNVELIRVSRELATIHQSLPLELDLDALALRPADRKAAFKLFAEMGFKSLMTEFSDAEPQEKPTVEWLDPDKAADFFTELGAQSRVYLALKLKEGSLGHKIADLACVGGDSGPITLCDLKNERIACAWDRTLHNPQLSVVCWDAKLCGAALERRGIRLETRFEDVMVMAFLIAPHVGDYSLKRWAMEQLHLSLQNAAADGLLPTDAAQAEIGNELSSEWNAVRLLFGHLDPQLDGMGLRRLYQEIEQPLIPVLADMERIGVKIDPTVLQALSSEMQQEIGGLTRRIYDAAGMEFNINSPKQLGEVLFEKLNLPTHKKTRKTKGYSTDQAVLEELAESYELPQLILEYRQFTKLKSTYVDTLPALIESRTGRVHTSYNQTGAATGRLSSSDPNLQNIPIRTDLGRRIRGAFVPEQGNRFISADYSQVELRVLADLSEDEVLIDAFRHDEDIHDRTAREVFSEAELANRSECRRKAKMINFGIAYGLSAFGLSQRLGISREDAQAYIDAYFERYRGVRAWLDRTIEEARRTGVVRTLFGRIRPIPDIHSKDYALRQFAERTAVNSPIQGTAADIMKLAMIRIWKSLQSHGCSSKILLQVHDELVLECPWKEIGQVQEIVRHEMEHAVELRVPLRVETGLGDNWMEMK